ncbi:PA14 domain-containing protein [Sulfurospirillum diekertiae]
MPSKGDFLMKKSPFLTYLLLLFFISNVYATNGLIGKYYNKTASTVSSYPITGTPNLTRIDATVNFPWDNSSPDSSIQTDNFQVIWSGYIYIPKNGTWTFYTQSDDGVKLTINGSLIINNWTDHASKEDSQNLTLNKGYYPIIMEFYEKGGGAVAQLKWQGPSVSKDIIPTSNLSTYPSLTITDANLTEGDTGYKNMNFIVTISETTNASVKYATADGTVAATAATAGSDYNATNGTLIFSSSDTNLSKIISIPIKGDTLVENNETFTVTLSNEVNATIARAIATGTIINDDMGYCAQNNLTQGYHIIAPDGNTSHSFEVYCDRSNPNDIKDVIKLPLSKQMASTEFSNFTFNASLGTNENYYDDNNAKTYINYIRIDARTLEIIPDNTSGFYNGNFSNLNFRGTPFTFDWNNMSASNITGCTLSKMRRDYDISSQQGGQVLKINPKKEDVYKCTGKNLKLKLLDDYKFVIYDGAEVLKPSCKQLSEQLPANGEYANITGYFYIDPKVQGRDGNQLLSDYRPFVAYCMEVAGSNAEDKYSWTMFLTLDGVRTENHSDIKNGQDTCTNLGLFFFVPNSQTTFNKVKTFLYDQKAQWSPYTGQMGEYFSDRNIAGWGTSYETTRYYWPYGPMGLYYDDGSTSDGILDPGAAGSWTPITNGRTINGKTYGYDLTSSSEINGTSVNIAHISTGTGWKTTLEEMGYPSDFWITTFSAGDFSNSAPMCSGGNTINCYLNARSREPNGDYTYGNWMHFWADDNGNIYHYNDQGYAGTINDRYRHDHYMCMAKDNYQFVTRYKFIPGPFKAIEHTVATGNEATDTAIKTKIVNAPIQLDIALLNDAQTAVEADKNVSVGIFLEELYTVNSAEITQNIYYFGDIKKNGSGTFNALKSTGRFELPSSAWPSGVNKWTKANKNIFPRFYFCARSDHEWTDCWSKVNNTTTCIPGCTPNVGTCDCQWADSNNFAVRPNNFDFNIAGASPYKAGVGYSVTFSAKDYTNANTTDYNETIPVTPLETKAGCITGIFDTNLSNLQFENGTKVIPSLSYSEVGVINIKMQETSGLEFANVDASDTPDSERYITPYDQNWTYTPDHFSLASTFKNYKGGNFTYISNDLNMSSELNVTIIAQRLDNNTTQNYNSACYAKATDYNISYDALTISPANALTQIKFFETNTSTTGSSLIGSGLNLAGINKSIFGTDNNGTAKLNFKINFDRNITKASNPLKLNFRDLNVTDVDTIKGTTDINQSSPFYYGRVYSTDYRAPSPIDTTIRYEVYCKDCNTTAFNAIGTQSPLSLNWYQNPLHVISDGNVTTFASATTGSKATTIANATVSTINAGTGIDTTHRLTNTNAPYTDRIKMTPSLWLLYNASNAAATTNDFNVEFTRIGSWSGAGGVDRNSSKDVGKFTNTNDSNRSNKKMNW